MPADDSGEFRVVKKKNNRKSYLIAEESTVDEELGGKLRR